MTDGAMPAAAAMSVIDAPEYPRSANSRAAASMIKIRRRDADSRLRLPASRWAVVALRGTPASLQARARAVAHAHLNSARRVAPGQSGLGAARQARPPWRSPCGRPARRSCCAGLDYGAGEAHFICRTAAAQCALHRVRQRACWIAPGPGGNEIDRPRDATLADDRIPQLRREGFHLCLLRGRAPVREPGELRGRTADAHRLSGPHLAAGRHWQRNP